MGNWNFHMCKSRNQPHVQESLRKVQKTKPKYLPLFQTLVLIFLLTVLLNVAICDLG